MATVNITITATVQQLSNFADELGYFPKVLDENGEAIDNPQDKKSFLQEHLKKTLVNELAKIRIRAIESEVRDQREADKKAVRENIDSAISVSFQQ